ncbi:hypothetical protein [Sphingobacterium sp.]|uniref:hypothetical protein n=1 Tax=Sphingobacterium sp. TaxID=341027 RepID=UPI0028A0A07F|nr:hypothetical protein [Sphingobacterium sp.]
MHNQTIAKSLLDGTISPRQAYDMIEYLYDRVTEENTSTIQEDEFCEIDSIQCFHNLAATCCHKDFNPSEITFNGIEDIKTDVKEVWIIHALLTPFSFANYSSDSDHPFNDKSLEYAAPF